VASEEGSRRQPPASQSSSSGPPPPSAIRRCLPPSMIPLRLRLLVTLSDRFNLRVRPPPPCPRHQQKCIARGRNCSCLPSKPGWLQPAPLAEPLPNSHSLLSFPAGQHRHRPSLASSGLADNTSTAQRRRAQRCPEARPKRRDRGRAHFREM
jgi:hypothetical protein